MTSEKKIKAARKNAAKAVSAIQARMALKPVWRCANCQSAAPGTVHQMRKTYCSKACMAEGYRARMRGAANPNYRNAAEKTCEYCGSQYFAYLKTRRYCSTLCASKVNDQLRTRAKKDANHTAIVDALKAGGVSVVDLSTQMFGVPDLLLWDGNSWELAEVKNPGTYYGRKGLNKAQREWAEAFQGSTVYVLRTLEDVEKFLTGRRSEVEHVGGFKGKQ